MATINDQKNWDLPKPNWCKPVAGFLLNLIPYSKRTWFTVSDAEWYDYAHMEALPVKAAAINFVTAMPRFPNNAA